MHQDVKGMIRLLAGFLLLATGIYLTKQADLGLAPWGVFHDGLDIATGGVIGFGFLTQIVGVVLLIISVVFFKTKIGVGTILNIVIIGPVIQLLITLYDGRFDGLGVQIPVFVVGLVIMSFGRGLYISAQYGQGPRDGIFVGIARITHFQVKYIKPTIELTVFIIGWLLGGAVGLGTVIIVVFSGYLVQFFFKILGYDPKSSKQRFSINFHKKEESSI